MAANAEYEAWEAVKREMISGGGVSGASGGSDVAEALVVSGGVAVLSHDPVSVVRVYWGGLRLTEGGDYTRTGRTISTGIANGETLVADYRF